MCLWSLGVSGTSKNSLFLCLTMVVAELLDCGAPIPLILVCLLLGFNPKLNHKQDSRKSLGALVCVKVLVFFTHLSLRALLQDYDYLEIFAGCGEVSAKCQQDQGSSLY